jgi:hypothetical protein
MSSLRKRYISVLWRFLYRTIFGLFIVPFLYKPRVGIRENRKLPWWYYMNDDYKPDDKDSGDFGRFKHNFIGFYQQNALRNPIWNYKVEKLIPNQGTKYNVLGDIRWCNKEIFDKRTGTYWVGDEQYFRWSTTYTVIRIWKLRLCRNIMLGATDNRYLFKFRHFWQWK